MKTQQSTNFFRKLGGRKQFNGYMATLLLTTMAPFLGASFPEYSLGILGALGVTSGLIVMEDEAQKRYARDIRMGEMAANAPTSPVQAEVVEVDSLKTPTARSLGTNNATIPQANRIAS